VRQVPGYEWPRGEIMPDLQFVRNL